jgi:hypothetical protein
LRSAGHWDLDGSVFRQFPIHESLSLEFRAEGFNLLNNVILVNNTASNPRELQMGATIIF